MTGCRACGHPDLDPALDLGRVPLPGRFPLRETPVRPDEVRNRLAMLLCRACGLAQLGCDAGPDAHRTAVRREDRDVDHAVRIIREAGLLSGGTISEFGSPEGERWLPRLQPFGFRSPRHGEPASVVVDSFVLERELDQRRALRERAAALAPDGTLLLEFHSLSAVIAQRRWDALQYGRFAYYTVTTLRRALEDVGLLLWNVWPIGPTADVILAAAFCEGELYPEPFVRRRLAAEREEGITTVRTVRVLQSAANRDAAALHTWLRQMALRHRTVIAYGATASTVTLFTRAHVSSTLVAAVADGTPGHHGRRMPGTDVPIVAPHLMASAAPDHILVTAPRELAELRSRYPELGDRWTLPPRGTDELSLDG
ncbi:class I SAM-dependent methyltransferase [Rhodococcus sp. (in: high G+C Gram-positive bacteria)]|uniref:class I SAM-dependent methyltransferase n=1 Tax=Rhodococcus sp. TaxID=1831 RepID=UPI0038902FCE